MNDLGLTDAQSNLKELEKHDALTRETHNLFLIYEVERMKDNKVETDSMILDLYRAVRNADSLIDIDNDNGIIQDVTIYLEDEGLI